MAVAYLVILGRVIAASVGESVNSLVCIVTCMIYLNAVNLAGTLPFTYGLHKERILKDYPTNKSCPYFQDGRKVNDCWGLHNWDSNSNNCEKLGPGRSWVVSECCSERLFLNDSCPAEERCSPGCYQVWTNNGSISCIRCTNETILDVSQNLTECREVTTQASEIHMNLSTTPSVPHHLSNPGVAASLLLGTLFISLFLVLSVASFFYLKRSHMLPEIFYRRNKASILQPSEMASMIPEPNPSGRKPRYVRRERTHKAAAPVLLDPSADTQVSNV